MSPRIAFWTSAFESRMEAVAGEVALLRQRFPSSIAWGLHPSRWLRLSFRREVCLHPRLTDLFRVATRMLEPLFQLNHVVGSLGDWCYLEGPRRRPTVLTVATHAPPVNASLLERVDRFVVEYPEARAELTRLGLPDERIRVILPPVDLLRFQPTAPPDNPFTVLFASSPDNADWLSARGLPALLDAAAARPHMRFRLLWRPWGNSLPVLRQWIADRDLHNVNVVVGRVDNMAVEYQSAHITIAPFTQRNCCKPAPNSLIESLACGRPVLTTGEVGLHSLITESGSGVVCEPHGDAIAAELDRLQADWAVFSRRAQTTAETCFDQERFVRQYAQVYDELLTVT